MKKIMLIFATIAVLSSCSSDEGLMDNAPIDSGIKSALDQVFTVEKMSDDLKSSGNGGGLTNIMCTDLIGNFYYLNNNSDNEKQEIKKYDPITKELTTSLTLPSGDRAEAIAVDNKQNIFFITSSKLFKISATDKSIVDLTSRIPMPNGMGYMEFCGLCAGDNGNVFFSGYDIKDKFFKITSQGVITKIASYERGELPYLKGSNLVKSKGSFIYAVDLTEGNRDYMKVNTTTGVIEYLSANTAVNGVSATHSKNNPYAIRGLDIVRIRPTEATDLLIGTIPSYIMDENGEFVSFPQPRYLCMNAEATTFYVTSYGNEIYKLTLE